MLVHAHAIALIATLAGSFSALPNPHSHSAEPYENHALAFDGDDDFATVPACDAVRYPGNGGWTVELWVKPIAYPVGTETSIVGQESVGVSARDPWSLRVHPTHFEFRVDGPKGDTGRVRFDLTPGVWQHVACVYEGPGSGGPMTMTVYVDAERVATQSVTVRMESRDDPVYFGALSGTHFRGLVDDARVWAHALSHDAVRSAMGGDVDASDPRLRAWWDFDGSSAAVALDRSGSGAHAVLGRPHDPGDTSRPTRVNRTRR